MPTVMPTVNPCLQWLLMDAPAPFPMKTHHVREAVEWLEARRARAVRRFLRWAPDAERYVAVLKADRDLSTLETWTVMAAPYHGPSATRVFEGLFLAMNARHQKLWQRLNQKGSAFRDHLVRLRRKFRRERDQRWSESMMTSLNDGTDSTYLELQAEVDAFELRVSRRESRVGRKIEQKGGTLFSHWPARPNPALEGEARTAAIRRQERGFLFYPTEDPAIHLVQRCRDPQVRFQLWLSRQEQVSVRPQDIEKMRHMRQVLATHMNHEDHVVYQMHETTFLKPDMAERVMLRALEKLKGPMRRAALRGARRQKLGEVLASDFGFALTHGSQPKDIPEVSPRAFPWRTTSIKIVNELMALGGWQSLGAPLATGRGTGRLLRFSFLHTDGRKAQLWYGPFNPSPSPNDQTAAQACLVRSALAEETNIERVCMIDHRLPADRQHFSLLDIQYLCHELGHILHFLALPGHTFVESTQLTADFSEVPSILLESYYRDPTTLIRWLSPRAPKTLRQRAYWACRLQRDPIHVLWYQRSMFRAYLDLRLHRKDSGTLDEVLDEVSNLLPYVRNPEMREHLNYFDWSSLSGLGISHLAGEAMAHRLVPIPANGMLPSSEVGQKFQQLLDVLGRGVTGVKLKRSWRQWAGESMTASMDEGFRSLTRYYSLMTRDQRRRAH